MLLQNCTSPLLAANPDQCDIFHIYLFRFIYISYVKNTHLLKGWALYNKTSKYKIAYINNVKIWVKMYKIIYKS